MDNYNNCLNCSKQFPKRKDSPGTFCSRSCNASYNNKRRIKEKQPTGTCLSCNSILFNSNKFCNRSCSASYNNSRRIISKRQESKTDYRILSGLYSRLSWCKVCGTYMKGSRNKTCSPTCLLDLHKKNGRSGGQKSASSRMTRSKDEIELFNLCKSKFSNVTHNQIIVDGWDADILIHDLKFAILWNGPWHYKEMPGLKHSLLQVQTRDALKLKALEREGWHVFIFEDREYTPQTAFEKLMDAGGGVEPDRP